MHDTSGWQRKYLEQPIHARPRQRCFPRSSVEPLLPDASDEEAQHRECSRVACDPVVRIVTAQLPTQRGVLFLDWQMTVRAAPRRNAFQRATQASCHRLALDHPVALSRHAPKVRESQQIEACTFTACRTGRGWTGRTYEANQPCFLWV